MAKDGSSSSTSLVSRTVVVDGEISGEENLHVDGRVKGIIRLTGDLVVGSAGVVEAEVDARNVVVQGSITGKVVAHRQLEVQASGRFNGECAAASYEIREGAVFEGISRMLGNMPPEEKASVSPTPKTKKPS